MCCRCFPPRDKGEESADRDQERLPEELYDFARMMTKNFERITIADIDNICHACCHYELRMLSDGEQKKLHLDFGEKDFDWKYSRKTVPVYILDAELVIRPGYRHCGYMAAEPKAYVEQLEAFMGRVRA